MMRNVYLQITPFFPSESDFRGAYIFDQVQAIKDNSNYQVIVIKVLSLFDKADTKPYLYQGIYVYPFKVIDLPFAIIPGFFKPLNTFRLLRFFKSKLNISLDDIAKVHAHVSYPAGQLASAITVNDKKIQSYIQHHGLDVLQLENGRFLKGAFKKINQTYIKYRSIKSLNEVDLNIGVSQKVIDELKNISDNKSSKYYVLYNGVNKNKFFKVNNIKKSDKFTIGCIANFWPLKDQMTLLKALQLLNDSNVFIKFIGTGHTLHNCQAFVQDNHLEKQVEFLSEIDHSQLNQFYNSLDLFVLPSFYEAFGCVYAEALTVGVPIIAVKGQGIEEILTESDKTKLLIRKGDVVDLSEKIKAMKNTPETINYNLDINMYIKGFLKKTTENRPNL